MFWFFLLSISFIIFLIEIKYLYNSFKKTKFISNLASNNNYLIKVLSLSLFIYIIIFLIICVNIYNMIIIILHLGFFLMLTDLIFFIIKKNIKRKIKKNYSLAIASLLCVIYLTYGVISNYHVSKKTYDINTNKYVSDLKIVMFADSHVGSTFTGKGLYDYVLEMNKEKPDIVVIAGDFVDERTSKKDMIDACKSLSYFDTKYGVYFIYGNHDNSKYFGSTRNWKDEELKDALIEANVFILEDQYILINNEYYIVGRKDKSKENKSGRLDIDQLIDPLDNNKYIICIDHQPNDYKNEENSKLDLVLSGHTHGGQFFPLNLPFLPYGNNDLVYGHERRNNKDFIVTSGISDWAFKFKTGTNSEYVVINIDGNK